MKVYVAVKNGKPVRGFDGTFVITRTKTELKKLILALDSLRDAEVVQKDLAILEKVRSLPEDAIECFAVVCCGNKFVLQDGTILVGRTKDVLNDLVAPYADETVVRTVLY